MTHVFINKEYPIRIKMIEADNIEEAFLKLARRLGLEKKSGFTSDYLFGYYI